MTPSVGSGRRSGEWDVRSGRGGRLENCGLKIGVMSFWRWKSSQKCKCVNGEFEIIDILSYKHNKYRMLKTSIGVKSIFKCYEIEASKYNVTNRGLAITWTCNDG